MELIDTHAHLYADDFCGDITNVIQAANRSHISFILLPAIDSEYHEKMIKVSRDFRCCLPMMGLHPTSVKQGWEEEMKLVHQYFDSGHFIAVGETGIDLYWDKNFLVQQEAAFREQINIAIEKDLPLVIHSRESFGEIVRILDEYRDKGLKGVFHCFPGGINEAEKAIELGFHLGLGGVVTFKNSLMLEVAAKVPLTSILLETDAPWLAPVPFRGKRNEPSYLSLTADRIALARGITSDEVAGQTTINAMDLFRIDEFLNNSSK